MKLDITEDHSLILREVFSGIILETEEGNRISVCMRDDTLEINVIPVGQSMSKWRVDMQTNNIKPL